MGLARIDVDRENPRGIFQQQIKSIAAARADGNDRFSRLDLESAPVRFRIFPAHAEEQFGEFNLAFFRCAHSGTPRPKLRISSSTGPAPFNKGGSPIPCFWAICQMSSTR